MNFFRQKCDMERNNNNNNATDTMMCKETVRLNDNTTTHPGADNDNDENDKYMILSGGEETLPTNNDTMNTTKHRRTNRCGNFLIK